MVETATGQRSIVKGGAGRTRSSSSAVLKTREIASSSEKDFVGGREIVMFPLIVPREPY